LQILQILLLLIVFYTRSYDLYAPTHHHRFKPASLLGRLPAHLPPARFADWLADPRVVLTVAALGRDTATRGGRVAPGELIGYSAVLIEPDADVIYAICPQCGTKYLINDGSGAAVEGPSRHGLKPYNVGREGVSTLVVYN